MSLFEDRYDGPEMTLGEFYALRRRIGDWLRIKAKSDPSWGADIRLSPQQTLEQLASDIEHSSLLCSSGRILSRTRRR